MKKWGCRRKEGRREREGGVRNRDEKTSKI